LPAANGGPTERHLIQQTRAETVNYSAEYARKVGPTQ